MSANPDEQRMVIVIEYAITNDGQPIREAMEALRERLRHPDQPHARQVQVYAAIREDADAVLAVFEALS